MSKAVPSKPPIRPFRPTYGLTTATRVPGQRNAPLIEQAEPAGQTPPTAEDSGGVLA